MAGNGGSPIYVDGPWSHRPVTANGTRFHIAEAGEGPLVLLLHGFPQFWWTWRAQLTSLPGAGYRVVAADLRGYGGSDKPPRGYDLITAASDAAGMVRALGEANAVVDAAIKYGIPADSQALEHIKEWLERGPNPEARKAWYMYAQELRKRSFGHGTLALRRLLRLVQDYPRIPLVAAVRIAHEYGLYDLDRLERMVLRRTAAEYFDLESPNRPDGDDHGEG